MSHVSAGKRFRTALVEERPLQIVGTVNAYSALLAERAGFKAIYLSGAGVANTSFGLPDLAITSLNDVCEDVRRITGATEIPLLVDADTGWGSAFNIAKTVKDICKSGAAGIHLEDQVQAKRCGHRPNKALVSKQEMADRIRAAVDARTDDDFVIMARTDGFNGEGLDSAVARAQAYVEAGADMIFAEALAELSDYEAFTKQVDVPVLANITEFGKTPYFTPDQLREVGVQLVLHPLSAFRAMSKAAEMVYATLRKEGSAEGILDQMQTRTELYDVLGYHDYENKLDELFAKE